MSVDPLLHAAQRAWESTAFYRALYGARPKCLDDVTFINHASYHRAHGLRDCVTSLEAINASIPPLFRDVRRLPVNVVEDEGGSEKRHVRFLRALEDLGIERGGPRQRFLLISDDSTGPFACDLSDFLGWERHQASISYIDAGNDNVHADVEAYDPEAIIVVTPFASPGDYAARRRRVIAVHGIYVPRAPDPAFDTLLVCDEIQTIGSRPAGRDWFAYDGSQLVVEPEPSTQCPAVTVLTSSLFPVVRYGFGTNLAGDFRELPA
jgi:hypothetical protein